MHFNKELVITSPLPRLAGDAQRPICRHIYGIKLASASAPNANIPKIAPHMVKPTAVVLMLGKNISSKPGNIVKEKNTQITK